MSFDNVKFSAWLKQFERYLIESGMPEHQALKYRTQFYNDALGHFAADRTPGDAAMMELLGI